MWIKGRGRNAWCVLARSSSAKGKAGPSVRPDKSQSRTVAASRPGPSGGARQSVDGTGRAVLLRRARRAARLRVAVEGLARELAAARREIAVLRRENRGAERSTLDVIGAR
jgi:hypothetical protein